MLCSIEGFIDPIIKYSIKLVSGSSQYAAEMKLLRESCYTIQTSDYNIIGFGTVNLTFFIIFSTTTASAGLPHLLRQQSIKSQVFALFLFLTILKIVCYIVCDSFIYGNVFFFFFHCIQLGDDNSRPLFLS